MWTAIAGFFSRYLMMIVAAAFIGLGAVTGVLWLQKAAAERQAASLRIDKERLEAAAAVAREAIADRNDAIATLEWANRQREAQAAELNSLLEDIRNAKPSDDGPIAPVLDRLLRSLGRVR